MKQRIWELDALRGLCVLGMVIVHAVYDAVMLYRFVDWQYPQWFRFVQSWGGVLFLLISGICVTLGRNHVKRGALVLGCGLVITAATFLLYLVNFFSVYGIIWFGVLHCLGCCMLLWGFVKKYSAGSLFILGAVWVFIGFWMETIRVDTLLFIPLGLYPDGFFSSDYFPLVRNFGFFLIGSGIGKTVYKEKKSLFPRVDAGRQPVKFLILCGKLSLPIYMLHQVVLAGICELIKLVL